MGKKNTSPDESGQLTFEDCTVTHKVSEEEMVKIEGKLDEEDEKPLKTIPRHRKSKKLFVFTEEDMHGMVPWSKKDEARFPTGEFSIASGKIVSSKSYDNKSIEVVIQSESEKQLRIMASPEDSYYELLSAVHDNNCRLCVLMCNGICCDVKIGPIFGMVGWLFKKGGMSGKIATEYRVKS